MPLWRNAEMDAVFGDRFLFLAFSLGILGPICKEEGLIFMKELGRRLEHMG